MDENMSETLGMGTPVETGTTPPQGIEDVPRRVLLAGLGAVAEFADTVDQTVDRLVGRGEQVEEDLRQRAEDVRRQRASTRNRVRGVFRNAMDGVLDTISVPNKADMDTINVKLNILTRKIDDLQMQHAASPFPEPPPPPPTTGDLAT